MMCDRCGQRQASIYLTKVVNGNKAELHLCKQCAEKGDGEFFKDMSLVSILANLAGTQPKQPAEAAPPVVCTNCGFTLERFRREGRLGCEQCYRQFAADLTPMMRKIHGSLQHTGKRPDAAAVSRMQQEKKKPGRLDELKQQLKQAVKAEEYERAAALRDEIRALETAADGAAK
jgi:protein arginine kinase activator